MAVAARPLTEIGARRSPEAVLAGLLAEGTPGKEAGLKLCRDAASFGIGVRDYLRLAIEPALAETPGQYALGDGRFLDGYEASLKFLKLPVRDDYQHGITLELASQTFDTAAGTRALFPEVVDDMVRMAQRVGFVESTSEIVSGTRTISGNQIIANVIQDDGDKDNFRTSPVAQFGKVPVRRIQATQTTVSIWKYGSGYETSYEFNRRASLDLLTPYATRVLRELEASKVNAAIGLMINGDGSPAHAPATVVKQSSFAGATQGELQYKPLLRWLVSRAKAGVPIDRVVGNWDAYIEWIMLFAQPAVRSLAAGQGVDPMTAAERLATAGVGLGTLPVLNLNVSFQLASGMTPGMLLGFVKGETIEELKEAGSQIEESETAITTQTITYVKTENVGFRMLFGDTRQIYDYTTP